MSQIRILMVLGLSVALSAPAFANTTPISWDQFVAQCQNPKGSKDKQFEPEDIKIQCTVVNREYVEELPGSYDLPAAQTVSGTVVSSKLAVPADSRSIPASGRTGECVRYKEVERTTRFVTPLTCEAVLKIAYNGKDGGKGGSAKIGTPAEYCQAEAKHAKNGGKGAQETARDTGAVRNSCPADAKYPTPGKDPGKKA